MLFLYFWVGGVKQHYEKKKLVEWGFDVIEHTSTRSYNSMSNKIPQQGECISQPYVPLGVLFPLPKCTWLQRWEIRFWNAASIFLTMKVPWLSAESPVRKITSLKWSGGDIFFPFPQMCCSISYDPETNLEHVWKLPISSWTSEIHWAIWHGAEISLIGKLLVCWQVLRQYNLPETLMILYVEEFGTQVFFIYCYPGVR